MDRGGAAYETFSSSSGAVSGVEMVLSTILLSIAGWSGGIAVDSEGEEASWKGHPVAGDGATADVEGVNDSVRMTRVRRF